MAQTYLEPCYADGRITGIDFAIGLPLFWQLSIHCRLISKPCSLFVGNMDSVLLGMPN